MSDQDKRVVLILHETMAQSAVKDAVTLLMLLGAVGAGILLGSETLQWLGGAMWIVWILSRSMGGKAKTPAEAVSWIKERWPDA